MNLEDQKAFLWTLELAYSNNKEILDVDSATDNMIQILTHTLDNLPIIRWEKDPIFDVILSFYDLYSLKLYNSIIQKFQLLQSPNYQNKLCTISKLIICLFGKTTHYSLIKILIKIIPTIFSKTIRHLFLDCAVEDHNNFIYVKCKDNCPHVVEYFCSHDGFNTIKNTIENINIDMDNLQLIDFFQAVFESRLDLKDVYHDKFIQPIVSVACNRIIIFSTRIKLEIFQNLKYTTDIFTVIGMLAVINEQNQKNEENLILIEDTYLIFILTLIKHSTMSCRLYAIKSINCVLDYITDEDNKIEKYTKFVYRMNFTIPKISQWCQRNNITEVVLRQNLHH
ncbi:hypothetical protein A3Q56_04446, partial [Intoshia linei]